MARKGDLYSENEDDSDDSFENDGYWGEEELDDELSDEEDFFDLDSDDEDDDGY